jgi:hypothetical protein
MQRSRTNRARRTRARGLAAGAAVTAAALTCTAANPEPKPDAKPTASSVAMPLAPPVVYSWTDIRGRPISSEAMAGRITVIGFITTYDVVSQAQVRYLNSLLREHVPRVNVAVLVLEKPENLPMIEAYVNALELPFPVAIADPLTIQGDGPFKGLHHVPAITILDREGRERHRHLGLLDRGALEKAVIDVEIETQVGRKPPEGAAPSR